MVTKEGNIITSANDVDMIIDPVNGDTVGTSSSVRLVVDEFSLTKEDGSELVGSVGTSQPAGISEGDVTYSFSFSLMGDNVELWQAIRDGSGNGRYFSFTARKLDDDGNQAWEKSLGLAKTTNEEDTASTGDPYEFAVDGIGMMYDGN